MVIAVQSKQTTVGIYLYSYVICTQFATYAMSLMSKIAVQAHRTFSRVGGGSEQSFQQNLSKLRDLVCRLTHADLNFDESLVRDRTRYDPASGRAPVTFIDIWKDENFSMSIFVLKPGTRLPLHDHPGMHGLIRVIYGRMNVSSYTLLERRFETGFERLQRSQHWEGFAVKKGDMFTARRLSSAAGDAVDCDSDTLVLTPIDGNLHEIRTTDSPAAFFDILAPPYDDRRSGLHQCHYFKLIPMPPVCSEHAHSASDGQQCSVVCIPAPIDYWTDDADYEGPEFDPYSRTVRI